MQLIKVKFVENFLKYIVQESESEILITWF